LFGRKPVELRLDDVRIVCRLGYDRKDKLYIFIFHYFQDTGYKGQFKEYCLKEKIRVVRAWSPHKAALAENLIKQVERRLKRWMIRNRSNKWITVLKDLQNALNSRFLTSIGREPVSLDYRNKNDVFYRMYKKRFPSISKTSLLSVGQKVRILLDRMLFSKSYSPYFSDEIFLIDRINPGDPPLYILKDLGGTKLNRRYIYFIF
jgi:hypothetical protein